MDGEMGLKMYFSRIFRLFFMKEETPQESISNLLELGTL